MFPFVNSEVLAMKNYLTFAFKSAFFKPRPAFSIKRRLAHRDIAFAAGIIALPRSFCAFKLLCPLIDKSFRPCAAPRRKLFISASLCGTFLSA